MMLTKLIRQPKLRLIATLVSDYHESARLKPRITNDSTSNGYLTEAQWFGKRNIEFRNKFIVPGGKINEQPVNVDCKNIEFKTWNKFSEIEDIDGRLAEILLRIGHDEMTPIQKNTFDILNRQLIDLLGSAETGSGKTLAFLSPLLNNIMRNYPAQMMEKLKETNGNVQYPLFLVLAPTRELVEQICGEAKRLLQLSNLRVVNVIGGVNPSSQMLQLQDGCHSLIATPGRLIDFLTRGHISLKYCNKLVLDEADRMLDMGFEPQIRQLVSQFDLPKETVRHTSMFSATFPDDVIELAQSLMKPSYGQVLIGRNAGSSEACIPESIKQNFMLTDHGAIFADCFKHIEATNKKTIVFCNKKSEVDTLYRFASNRNVRVAALHGDYPQRRRQSELQLFKRNEAKVLIATSIAARGIDVCDVESVINLGLPMNVDEYMHRVGRCGRLGRPGDAMTLIVSDDLGGAVAKDLVKMLRRTKVEFPDFLMQQHQGGGSGGEHRISRPPFAQKQWNRPGYQTRNRYAPHRNDRDNNRYMR